MIAIVDRDEVGSFLTWPATHDQVVTASKLADWRP
jgi:hypothetical protein